MPHKRRESKTLNGPIKAGNLREDTLITVNMKGGGQATVSTITATADLGCPVDIVAVAKHLPLSRVVAGTKMAYAGGARLIVRGDCKVPRGRTGFPNQASLLLDIPQHHRVHAKIFHNGRMQIAGPKSMEEALAAWETALCALVSCDGIVMVDVSVGESGLISGHDDLLYSTKGEVIGWAMHDGKYFVRESVRLETIAGRSCFASANYRNGSKVIYSLDGEKVGEKKLVFREGSARRKYTVENGNIFSGRVIVGAEVVSVSDTWTACVSADLAARQKISALGKIAHCYRALKEKPAVPRMEGLSVHMVNAFFESPFRIIREELHKAFIADKFYSRWDPCVNPGVNLRYYDNPLAQQDPGKCPCKNRGLCCSCKIISVRCFNSGTVILTGLRDVNQVSKLFRFVSSYYASHADVIQESPAHGEKSHGAPSSD